MLPWNLRYKANQIPKLKCFSSRVAVEFHQSIAAMCYFENEDLVGAASTGSELINLITNHMYYANVSEIGAFQVGVCCPWNIYRGLMDASYYQINLLCVFIDDYQSLTRNDWKSYQGLYRHWWKTWLKIMVTSICMLFFILIHFMVV